MSKTTLGRQVTINTMNPHSRTIVVMWSTPPIVVAVRMNVAAGAIIVRAGAIHHAIAIQDNNNANNETNNENQQQTFS